MAENIIAGKAAKKVRAELRRMKEALQEREARIAALEGERRGMFAGNDANNQAIAILTKERDAADAKWKAVNTASLQATDELRQARAEAERLRGHAIRWMEKAWAAKQMALGDEIEGVLQPILPAERARGGI